MNQQTIGASQPVRVPFAESVSDLDSVRRSELHVQVGDDDDAAEDDYDESSSKSATTNGLSSRSTTANEALSSSLTSISSSPVNSNVGSPLRFVHSRFVHPSDTGSIPINNRQTHIGLKSVLSDSQLLPIEETSPSSSSAFQKSLLNGDSNTSYPNKPIFPGSLPNNISSRQSTRYSASYSAARVRFEKNVRRYYYQLTVGCKNPVCNFKLCASCRFGGPKLTTDASAIMAFQLASRPKTFFCPRLPLEPEISLEGVLFAPGSAPNQASAFKKSSSSFNLGEKTKSETTTSRTAPNGSLPRTFSAGMLFRNDSNSELSTSPNKIEGAISSSPQPFIYSLLSSSPFASIFQDSPANYSNNTTFDNLENEQSLNSEKRASSFFGLSMLSRIMGTSAQDETSSTLPQTQVSSSVPRTGSSDLPLGSPLGGMRTKSLMDLPSLLSASVGFSPRQSVNSQVVSPKHSFSPSNSSSNIRVSALTQALRASTPLTQEQVSDDSRESDDNDGDDFLYIKKIEQFYSTIDYLSLPLLKEQIELYGSAIKNSLEFVDEEAQNNDDFTKDGDIQNERFLIEPLETIFSSSEALNKSFLAEGESAKHPSGLDISEIRQCYALILSLKPKEDFKTAIVNSLEILLAKIHLNIRTLQTAPSSYLRQFIILLENPYLQDKEYHEVLLKKLCLILGELRSRTKHVFVEWFSRYDEQGLSAFINLFQTYIVDRFSSGPSSTRPDDSLIGAVKMLSVFYNANELIRSRRILPLSSFYNETLNRKLNFKEEYKVWKRTLKNTTPARAHSRSSRLSGTDLLAEQSANPIVTEFSFFNFPFLFDPVSKTRILHIDAMVQMSAEFEEAFVHQAFVIHAQRFLQDSPSATQLEQGMRTATNPYLVLSIRRLRLVQDTLEQLSRVPSKELKKPLKVRFVAGGEEGMDQGGVQKEFFQVLMNLLLDPGYGLFVTDEETKYVWINGASLESERTFELVGVVVGLALYNGVMLGVDFPTIIYRKLLDEEPDLEDIKQAFPQLGKGLQQLLDWTDGDVADVFLRTFEISYDVYGKVRTFPLVDGGSEILVSNDNRRQYVKLYIRHFATESVKGQFNAFKRGFSKVCGGSALKMCRPEELELLICGSTTSEMDFTELEKGAQYDDGYGTDHPIIRDFWFIFHNEFDLEHKRMLLSFVTSSDRVPLRGLGNLTFVIQRNGPDTDRLPTALTCFGRLLLPEYSGRDKLKARLTTAIENARGFGL
ncbi:hypothetical protein HK096_002642, partial [Nowakowskiella sp. JEL0078]